MYFEDIIPLIFKYADIPTKLNLSFTNKGFSHAFKNTYWLHEAPHDHYNNKGFKGLNDSYKALDKAIAYEYNESFVLINGDISLYTLPLISYDCLSIFQMSIPQWIISDHISHLYIDGSNIRVDEIECPHLNSISLIGCDIKTFDIKGFPDLNSLELDDNEIEELHLKHNKLERLELSYNPLKILEIDCPELKSLYVICCDLPEERIKELKSKYDNIGF